MLSDLGHAAKPFRYHRKWAERVSEEFFKQGDRERELNLPISPLCDRQSTVMASSQIGFFDVLALPLFHAVLEAIPMEAFHDIMDDALHNHGVWERITAVGTATSLDDVPQHVFDRRPSTWVPPTAS